jgi:hypothetical protein
MRVARRLLWCLSLIGVLAALTTAALGASTTWGTAIGVPGLENTADDVVTAISCSSAHNCAAAGYFRKGPGFVVNEKDEVWGTEIDVQYGVSDYLGSISCATAGSCAAGGSYTDGGGHSHAFLVNKRHGAWGKPMKVPGLTRLAHGDAYLNTISCPEPGFCAAGGLYGDSDGHWQAYIANERNGVWHNAIEVPGSAALNAGGSASVSSVSCSDARSCTAGGQYSGPGGAGGWHPFLVDERDGVWGMAMRVPGFAALTPGGTGGVTAVSCAATDSCAAVGNYNDAQHPYRAFVVNERNGVWRKAIVLPGLAALDVGGAEAFVHSLSCATAGSCAAAGSYTDGSGFVQAFVVRTTNGIWRKAIEVPGSEALNVGGNAVAQSTSCAKAGFCGVGGFYFDGSGTEQAFVVSETNGVWNTAVEVPGLAALNVGTGSGGQAQVDALSCGGPRSCAAGGYYVGSFAASQGFVTSP